MQVTSDDLKRIICLQRDLLNKLSRNIEEMRTALATSYEVAVTNQSVVRKAKAQAERMNRKEAVRLMALVTDEPLPTFPEFEAIEIPELPSELLGANQ